MKLTPFLAVIFLSTLSFSFHLSSSSIRRQRKLSFTHFTSTESIPSLHLNNPQSHPIENQEESINGEGKEDENYPSLEELENVLEVAKAAAFKAGELIRDNIGARVKYSKTNYKDVVTEIDLAAQRVIETAIQDAFPTHSFLGTVQ